MARGDAEMHYPIFHMKFFDVKFIKDANVISNDENVETISPDKASVYLYKPVYSKPSSSESKSRAKKRKRSRSLSKALPKKKRSKTSSFERSQAYAQLVQHMSSLHMQAPSPSPAVATAPKATSSQGEKATGSKDTASTASDAIPSTSSGLSPFIAEGLDKETITYHTVASYLENKHYKDRCAIGGKILEGHVAWQVNAQVRLLSRAIEPLQLLCEVGFWTDYKAEDNDDGNSLFTLNIAAVRGQSLRVYPEWQESSDSIYERKLEIGETVTVKIAFAWNPSRKAVFVCMDGKELVELKREAIDLKGFTGDKICPIFILGEAVRNEKAVVTVKVIVGTEVDGNFRSCW